MTTAPAHRAESSDSVAVARHLDAITAALADGGIRCRVVQHINRTLAGWASYFRHGVSKAAFNAADSHAWNRIMRWLRRKYKSGTSGIGMPELRRRFCLPGTCTFAHNGVRFTGASSVPVTRYRYRGSTIPAPFPVTPLHMGRCRHRCCCGRSGCSCPSWRRLLKRLPLPAGVLDWHGR